jgi:hypothetical protein
VLDDKAGDVDKRAKPEQSDMTPPGQQAVDAVPFPSLANAEEARRLDTLGSGRAHWLTQVCVFASPGDSVSSWAELRTATSSVMSSNLAGVGHERVDLGDEVGLDVVGGATHVGADDVSQAVFVRQYVTRYGRGWRRRWRNRA